MQAQGIFPGSDDRTEGWLEAARLAERILELAPEVVFFQARPASPQDREDSFAGQHGSFTDQVNFHLVLDHAQRNQQGTDVCCFQQGMVLRHLFLQMACLGIVSRKIEPEFLRPASDQVRQLAFETLDIGDIGQAGACSGFGAGQSLAIPSLVHRIRAWDK